ncbi:hypothetical protein GCM10022243_22540 [Saccharothrix violaceirubra]|uniref:Fatty acid desaturase n=1 Tax=Saccharothrix violaceirubra TaxID=413306 RepID=A0A7W7T1G1_9PSEU|nr:hypothetical protein [Saccharothrix violaceirubra]MBB4964810.1 fatty acid desaturase [Saccharothrix violaceirubra]
MTHHQPTLSLRRDARTERRVWTVFAALFLLVAGANALVALSEDAWWQLGAAAVFLAVAAGCARRARGGRD